MSPDTYVATKLERYSALVDGQRVPRVAVHGRRATIAEIDSGEDLGGRNELYLGTALAVDLWVDDGGNDWCTVEGSDVLLANGWADIIRELGA